MPTSTQTTNFAPPRTPPTTAQLERRRIITDAAQLLANVIVALPESQERDAAIQALRVCTMWTNLAIENSAALGASS